MRPRKWTFPVMPRRAIYASLGAIALVAANANASPADARYPDRPVKIVVGFAPGGTNDILARVLSTKLQQRLKQSFVVENKPGANSAIGTDYVAKAAPDGYTLLVSSSGGLTTNPVTMANLAYDPVKDFEPIALLGSFPLVVTVNASLPVKNYAELVSYAKSKPDGMLNHGAISSSFQLASELLASKSGIKLNQVNYRGSGPALVALMAGEVDVECVDSAAVLPQMKSGKLRALAVTTAKRSPAWPGVPTVAESGVPGFDVPIWTALMAPKGTPKPVLDKLRSNLKEILAEKDTIDRFVALGMEPGNTDSQALADRISSDIKRWAMVAKTANIKPQ
ncbi:tripartite tricarboxylate transporter substrate binding protein [Cupriavidus sp. L7L]|uniref:Bug family tripartite tricarboxylate transporter substrate binding protein n=1 Tax=Cupriavidus sp. L7L TaxID=2546443 RepID=UPI001FB80A3E|nr:tripartite tricarboxylate transporter substrate binding protein [Cupriavidus sp. L7L]